MIPAQLRWGNIRTEVVELKGGINENVSSLELQSGELIDVKNYMIAEGGYGGYVSVKGFERLDGITLPSQYESYVIQLKDASNPVSYNDTLTGNTSGATAIALEDGRVLSGSYLGGDAVVEIECLIDTGTFTSLETISVSAVLVGTLEILQELTGATSDNNLAIEYARSQVMEVPGEEAVLAVNVFEGKVYAFRKKVGLNEIGFYVEDPGTGWLEIVVTGGLVYTGDHDFNFTNYNFYPTVNSRAMYWSDGQNPLAYYDLDGNCALIPNAAAPEGDDRPINVIAFADYLVVAFRGGVVQHSVVGEPVNWEAVDGAGEMYLGDEVTDMEVGVKNTLLIYLVEGIRVLSGLPLASAATLEAFSETSGAYKHTVQRLLGTHFFVDDRGLTTLEATDQFGDYSANAISQRFKRTLQNNSQSINATVTSRDLNQYRIFFANRSGIIVSFEGKEFQGATFFDYPKEVRSVSANEDGEGRDLIVFTSDDGYVRKLDSGFSFDGVPITCRLTTAFYHYKSPRNWKTFKRATLEIAGDTDQMFDIRINFDYNEPETARGLWYDMQIYTVDGTAIYGEGRWGIMKYGTASAVTNRVPVYLSGVGVNASYKVISNEAYRPQHIIQNIITDFESNGRRL